MAYYDSDRTGSFVIVVILIVAIFLVTRSCTNDMREEGAKRAAQVQQLVCDDKVIIQDNEIEFWTRSGTYIWYDGNETGLEGSSKLSRIQNTYAPLPGSRCSVRDVKK